MTLEKGCTVYLRSGSCKMTVLSVRKRKGEVLVRCIWSVYGTCEIRRDTFPACALDVLAGPRPRDATTDDGEVVEL